MPEAEESTVKLIDRLLWRFEARSLSQRAGRIPKTHGVTVVLTSCARHHLLRRTLDSFFRFNSCPIERFILVEDGPKVSSELQDHYRRFNIEWIETGERVGQIAAIDYAYSRVQTPYIFHLEDDWEFYKSGFIEKSMAILIREPKCLQVWLRALDDTNQHPIEPREFRHRSVTWRRMAWNYDSWGVWHGFSFNPGLRRLTDYRMSGGYGSLGEFDFRKRGTAEAKINHFYWQHEFYAVILSDNSAGGYVRHIGWNETVRPPARQPRDSQTETS